MNRVTMLVFGLVVFASTMGFGQAADKPTTPDLDLKALDCRPQWGDLESCKSFTELVQKKDKRLLMAFGPKANTLVCFRSNEDAFFTITWGTPKPEEFREAGKSTKYSGFIATLPEYKLYSDGILEEQHQWFVAWTSTEASTSTDKATGKFYADASEVRASFSFENTIGTTTKCFVSIRRSTGRFTEGRSAPEKKGGEEETFYQTGRCLQYPPPVQ